ncbi:MAG: hypothetical protein GOU97_03850 [Nanoarchaeota archaeon]|nr:hypothetical protein [Nanoarchaeota archaeon]
MRSIDDVFSENQGGKACACLNWIKERIGYNKRVSLNLTGSTLMVLSESIPETSYFPLMVLGSAGLIAAMIYVIKREFDPNALDEKND